MSQWSNTDGTPLRLPSPEEIPDDDGVLRVRPLVVPPISADSWRTMSESLFRALLSPGLTLLVSPAALDAIRERAQALGIDLDR